MQRATGDHKPFMRWLKKYLELQKSALKWLIYINLLHLCVYSRYCTVRAGQLFYLHIKGTGKDESKDG
jgi:hypothetical protein